MFEKAITIKIAKIKYEQMFIIDFMLHICLTYDKVSARWGMCYDKTIP